MFRFITRDHPEARGRSPKAGDDKFTAKYPLEDGGTLLVEMGLETLVNSAAVMMKMLDEDPELKERVRQSLKGVTSRTNE